jgi:hypothetical protein
MMRRVRISETSAIKLTFIRCNHPMLDDWKSKDLRNVGKKTYIYTVSPPRNKYPKLVDAKIYVKTSYPSNRP